MTPVTYWAIVESMTSRCQAERLAIAVSGEAGSGKSTLARHVAEELALPMLDLDTLTVPLLDQLRETVFENHWLAPPHDGVVRTARYAALYATAAEVVATAGGAVLVAPFTAELAGGSAWADLVRAVSPVELEMIYLRGDPELFARRRAHRGQARDAHRTDTGRPVPPAVQHVPIDAELTPAQQGFRVLRALGRRNEIDPGSTVLGRNFDAVLCDLDGVLADSTASVLRCWGRFAEELGISAAAVESNHGRPARALVERLLAPDRVAAALQRIEDIEVADATGVEPVPGAREFVAGLPAQRRAVVTSGTRRIAAARLSAVRIDVPAVLVTADDVRRGKPDPEPYLCAAARLDVDPARCLVVEDAPAGVAAARAAGCSVIGVLGTVEPDALAAADLIVDGLDRIQITSTSAGLHLSPAEPRTQPSR
ncbi:putative phosphatase YfbT [Pseudonocardia sp. Ae717_Ps2]|nr:putative phosphatase YfbT [Pseudonocardia sp. Ae717_Ps2]